MSNNLGLMTQSNIAELSGCTQPAISKIINGDRVPSLQMANDLEKATGICREAWLYPERHWNPYIPFKGQTACLSCQHRGIRSLKTMEISEADFKVNQSFQRISDILVTYYGQKGLMTGWRELIPGVGLKLLGTAGEKVIPIPEMLYKKDIEIRYRYVLEEIPLVLPHFPHGIPKDIVGWEKEAELMNISEVKSVLQISSQGVCFNILSFDVPMVYNPFTIPYTTAWVKRIADIYRGHF